MRNMLPPSLPSLKESSSPEGRALGNSLQAEATSPQHGSGQLSSAPIVLSRQNSSSSEEGGAASEPEAAGVLSPSSEELDSGGGSAQTTVRAPELAHSASGDATALHQHMSHKVLLMLRCCREFQQPLPTTSHVVGDWDIML